MKKVEDQTDRDIVRRTVGEYTTNSNFEKFLKDALLNDFSLEAAISGELKPFLEKLDEELTEDEITKIVVAVFIANASIEEIKASHIQEAINLFSIKNWKLKEFLLFLIYRGFFEVKMVEYLI